MNAATSEAGSLFDPRDGVTSSIGVSAGDGNTKIVSMVMTPEGFNLLRRLADETNADLETVLGKALILYREAHDASKQGKAVGIAESSDAFETQFTGL